MEDISHESSPDPMTGTPKDESAQETFETPREINRIDQSLEPENLNNLEKHEAQEQINEDINEDEILLQPRRSLNFIKSIKIQTQTRR